MSFSCSPQQMQDIYALNEAQSLAGAGKTVPISATISLLIQRGIAYTQLLAEKAQETVTPGAVAVKPKHRNKKW